MCELLDNVIRRVRVVQGQLRTKTSSNHRPSHIEHAEK